MKVISYRITLLEPLLVTGSESNPNEVVSFKYIPGSALRGALIGKYIRRWNPTSFDAGEERLRRLFFDGTTRYLNGYPLDSNYNRTLPVPLSWQQDKNEVSSQKDEYPAPIYDFAIDQGIADIVRAQQVKAPFCILNEDKVRLIIPQRQLSVHTSRNRRYGRAIGRIYHSDVEEFSGAVYRYEALAAGQTFEALILCDYEVDAELLLPLLEGEVFIGGSRRAGYGRVRIHDRMVEDGQQASPGWREASGQPLEQLEDKLIVTFLSDVLLRDEYGQFKASPGVVAFGLERQLGAKFENLAAFMQCCTVGGFNRKWGLPLSQAVAIKKGSVFVYQLTNKGQVLDEGQLYELEVKGIGDRRAEGFGRLIFNWHTKERLQVGRKVSPELLEPVIEEDESKSIAERIVVRSFQQHLESALFARAVEDARALVAGGGKLPSSAQISRLRNIIRNELMQKNPDLERLKNYLRDIESRKDSRNKFAGARIGGRSLLAWLKETVKKSEFREWKQDFVISEKMWELGGVKPDISQSFRIQSVLRYIDAVLAYAMKDNKREESF